MLSFFRLGWFSWNFLLSNCHSSCLRLNQISQVTRLLAKQVVSK